MSSSTGVEPTSPFGGVMMKKYIDYGTQTLYRCPRTGFLCAWPLPTPEQLEEYYSKNYFSGTRYVEGADDQSQLSTWNRRLTKIESALKTKSNVKSLLDIGAGTGVFCKVAAGRSWSVSCVEFSDSGREQILSRVKQVDSMDKVFDASNYSDSQFDLVTMWAVIEHMPYDSTLLRNLYRIVKPGGLVSFSYPNPVTMNRYLFGANWRYFIPVEHLSFFPPALFRKLLGEAGFKLGPQYSVFSSQAFSDGVNSTCMRNLPRFAKKMMTRATRFTNKCLFHNDTYEVIGVKPS